MDEMEGKQPELEHSEQINELVKAMCEVNKVLENAQKDKTNPFFKSKYADLTEIFGVCRKPLAENGLVVIQTTMVINDKTYMITRLIHTSGQWIKGVYPLNPIKNDPQGYGSAVTYARRYTLSAIIGITAEDDDGNKASKQNGTTKKETTSKPTDTGRRGDLTENDLKRLAEIDKALMELNGGNKNLAAAQLKKMTSFTGNDGVKVQGKSSTRFITSSIQTKVLHGDVHKIYMAKKAEEKAEKEKVASPVEPVNTTPKPVEEEDIPF